MKTENWTPAKQSLPPEGVGMTTEEYHTSIKWPPSDDCRIERTFEHRDGTRIKYIHGKGARTESEVRQELSAIDGKYWCHWCAGEVWFERSDTSRFNGYRYGKTHPRFFRYTGWHCPDCEKRLSAIDALAKQIATLNEEIKRLEDWSIPYP